MANKNNQQAAPVAEQTISQSEAFFLKNKKAIIAVVIAIVVVIAGIVLYKTYVSGPRELKASTAIAKGQDYFAAGDYQKALNGDSASFKGFVNLANEYSSTKAGNLANLYAGLSYAKLDKWQEAADYLEKFDGSDDAMISPAAVGALGNAYASLNQLDKAVEQLKKGAEKANNMTVSPQAYIQAAEILESQKKNADALELYKKAKTYIDRMDVQAQNALNRLNIDAYIERASQR